MPIKLLLAKPADYKDLAKVSIDIWNEKKPNTHHTLNLHQNRGGAWHPELKLSLGNCADNDIGKVRALISETLAEIMEVLMSAESNQIKMIADMLSEKGE